MTNDFQTSEKCGKNLLKIAKFSLFSFEGIGNINMPKKFPVMMRLWETPVPMPNTSVKPIRAHDTAGEALWESRSSPVTLL